MQLKTIGFRGTDADRARLEREAKAQEMSLSEYIRRKLELEATRKLRKVWKDTSDGDLSSDVE